MPIVNRIAALSDEMAAWRHDFHENPELLYEVHRTAGIVADRLREFGCDEVVTGIGRTGVVGVIRGRKSTSGKTIGLRADMDALPIEETSGVSYASKIPGKMHACGHDGHTAMLLGAAKYLAETRNFDGTAVVIFQPAEEGGAGGKAMLDDGLMTRWGIQEVYGLHNMPGLPEGHFHTTPGAMLASADKIEITVHGKGGHAGAGPHNAVDSVLVGSQIVNALQSIVSRNVDPLKSAVISITMFQAGTAFNIIPETAKLGGTVRTLDPAHPRSRRAPHRRGGRQRGAGLRRIGRGQIHTFVSGDGQSRAGGRHRRRSGPRCRRRRPRQRARVAADGLRKISHSCWKRAPALSSFSAWATAMNATTPATRSTTISSATAHRTGCG